MIDGRKLLIPESCRTFREDNLGERRDVAWKFVTTFVDGIAPPKGLDTDGAWTRSIRTRSKEICPTGCMALPENPNSPRGEFLVDFTWGEVDGRKRLLLAGESEWGSVKRLQTQWRSVEYDFEKLLSVKAPFKVLVFSSDYRRNGIDGTPDADFSIGYAIRRLTESLKTYGHNLPGETYMFIDFPRTGDETSPGVVRAFFWIAKELDNGAVEIEPLLEEIELIRPTKSVVVQFCLD